MASENSAVKVIGFVFIISLLRNNLSQFEHRFCRSGFATLDVIAAASIHLKPRQEGPRQVYLRAFQALWR